MLAPGDTDSLTRELEAYAIVNSGLSGHRNLPIGYGIAKVPINGETKRALLTTAVEGLNGGKLFHAASHARNSGTITNDQFFGLHQFVARRLVGLVGDMAKLPNGGIRHNDITPINIIFSKNSTEPVLVDFGGWSDTAGGDSFGGDRRFSALEYNGQNEQSELFMVASTLVAGINMHEYLRNNVFRRDPNLGPTDETWTTTMAEGQVVTFNANPHYAEAAKACMSEQITAEEAQNLKFLKNPVIDEAEAKAVIAILIKQSEVP